MCAAPLVVGNEVRHMTEEVKEILTNKEVRCSRRAGSPGNENGETEIFTKRLAHGSTAVGLFNSGQKRAVISHPVYPLSNLWGESIKQVDTYALAPRLQQEGGLASRLRKFTLPLRSMGGTGDYCQTTGVISNAIVQRS